MTELSCFLPDEAATVAAGASLAQALLSEDKSDVARVVYLQGSLGAGKTTFSRGVLHGLGHVGSVKSPTYTLVEPYSLPGGRLLYHFDLYRLQDPGELEYLGIEEYFQQGDVCLVEWPEQGRGMIPAADLCVYLRAETSGRRLLLVASSLRGESLLKAFSPPAK